MIVVYTAAIGARTVYPVEPCPGVRFVCFADRDLPAVGWEILRTESAGDPRRTARLFKTSSTRLFPSASRTVWMDGSFAMRNPHTLLEDAFATGCPIVGFPHPDRQRIREEAEAIVSSKQAEAQAVTRQLTTYHGSGFDTATQPQTVLTTTGLLVRDVSVQISVFDQLWQDQLLGHTLRDQLSVDWCAWQCGLSIGYLEGHYRSNPYAVYHRQRWP